MSVSGSASVSAEVEPESELLVEEDDVKVVSWPVLFVSELVGGRPVDSLAEASVPPLDSVSADCSVVPHAPMLNKVNESSRATRCIQMSVGVAVRAGQTTSTHLTRSRPIRTTRGRWVIS